MKTMNYGTGCAPSKLDGTEYVYDDIFEDVPEEYSFITVMPPVRDQGDTSKCVCYSMTAYMDWLKNLDESDNNGVQFNIDEIYNKRSNKPQEGMTIKEACSLVKRDGLVANNRQVYKIKGYAMVRSEEALKCALMANGPCLAGLLCYKEGQDRYFWRGRTNLGGHCITIIGWNKNGFIIRNSWGNRWADRGHVVLPYSDFNKIFEIWTMY